MLNSQSIVRRAIAFALVTSVSANAQTRDERVKWLQQHSIPIRTASPADTDFVDLDAVGSAIGDARIVMLGEATHGAGTTFLMKTRLIKYLHERKGFDVLAFESGLFDMEVAWRFLAKGDDPVASVRSGVFSVWSDSKQFDPLIDYLGAQARTRNPLRLAGFDNQITGFGGRVYWTTDLDQFVREKQLPIAASPSWKSVLFTLRGITYSIPLVLPTPAEHSRLMAALDSIDAQMARLPRSDETTEFWKQNLRSIRAHIWSMQSTDQRAAAVESSNTRDAQMAENLSWLLNKPLAGKKVIVWSATSHNARNIASAGVPTYQQYVTMGEIVSKEFGNQIFNIAFVASEGMQGLWMQQPSPIRLHTESLEVLWASTTHDFAMLNFRNLPRGGEWVRDTMKAGAFGFASLTAPWPKLVDALLYTRVMEPSTKSPR
jgi:erythromycin esterase